MSEAKHSVSVRILGEDHLIRTSADPAHTKRCARLLDERLAKLRSRAGALEPHRALLLAALSLTDELVQAEASAQQEREHVRARAAALTERLSAVLGPDV